MSTTTKTQAEVVVQDVTNYLNSFSNKNKAFIAEMNREHRTLQQSFTKLCLKWLEHCATNEYRFDEEDEDEDNDELDKDEPDNDLEDENSFFRQNFHPRFIKDTSENAYYNFFVLQDIKIDLLFIDGDHSYEGVKKDFDLYSQIMNDKGIIIIHDTDAEYEESLIVSEDAKKDYHSFDGPSKFVDELEKNPLYNLIKLHNFRILPNKPASTGITIINKK